MAAGKKLRKLAANRVFSNDNAIADIKRLNDS
jgi:hypothetical protein